MSASLRRNVGRLIVGRLTEYGRAPYRFIAGQAASYFVKLTSAEGARVIWGKDLPRAIRAGATRPKIGDVVGARRVARELVNPTPGTVEQHEGEKPMFRTRWEVEKIEHFANRARLARQILDRHLEAREAVRQHPELKSAYLTLRAAEAVAAERIPNPLDRKKFVDLVREAMAGSVNRGVPAPEIRIKERRDLVGRSREVGALRRKGDMAR